MRAILIKGFCAARDSPTLSRTHYSGEAHQKGNAPSGSVSATRPPFGQWRSATIGAGFADKIGFAQHPATMRGVTDSFKLGGRLPRFKHAAIDSLPLERRIP